MKKRMRFLAVAVLSLAVTTAFGQQGQGQGQSGTEGSGTYQQDQSQQVVPPVQSDQSGTQSRPVQSGQSGTQSRPVQSGQGMGSTEDRVNSEVLWMKTQFNLDAEKEQRLHDVLLKFERQSSTGGDLTKVKEEKAKEIKAIIGEDNYKLYKEKKKEREHKPGTTTTPQRNP